MDNDELVTVALTADERWLLTHGLAQWGGPAGCTEAMAIAMGFNSVDFLWGQYGQYDRLSLLMDRGEPLSRTDWTRTLLATEVCFVSDVLGAGVEWEIVTGGDDASTIEVLRVLQRKLLAAEALARWPSRSSAADGAAGQAARGDDDAEYETNRADELVAVELTPDERWLLTHGLLQWRGPARCTEAMAIAIGFNDVDDLLGQYDRLKALLDRGQPLSRADWTRTLLATEVCFASSVLGAGLEWEAIAGDDVFTLGVLRLLQRKLWKAGALAPQGGPRYEPPVNLKFEASPWPIDSTAQQPASPTWVASVTTPCHYTIAIPAGTTGIAMALIGGGGGGGAYLANGHSRFVPRGSCGESTTAKLPLGGLAGIKHCAAGGYGGITTDYAHLRHPSLTAGQSTDDVTPHMFPRGFVIRGGRGGAAGNDSPGGDGPAPGAGGGPGARLRPDGRPYGSYGGSGGFSGEYQSRVVWLPAKSTEADGLQITGFVGAGGAGDPGRDRDDGAFAGGNGGDGAAYFAFLSDPPPTQAVHASPEVSKPSPSQANSPPVQLPRFEIEPLPIRRAEFKLPRMLKRWRR